MKYLTGSKKRLEEFWAEHRTDYCPISGLILSNKALDHDHDNGMVRGYIDGHINSMEGRIKSAYDKLPPEIKLNCSLPMLLRGLADYYENPPITGILHPKGARDLAKRFKRKSKGEQLEVLEGYRQLGVINREIDLLSLKNEENRAKVFEQAIKTKKWKPKT